MGHLTIFDLIFVSILVNFLVFSIALGLAGKGSQFLKLYGQMLTLCKSILKPLAGILVVYMGSKLIQGKHGQFIKELLPLLGGMLLIGLAIAGLVDQNKFKKNVQTFFKKHWRFFLGMVIAIVILKSIETTLTPHLLSVQGFFIH